VNRSRILVKTLRQALILYGLRAVAMSVVIFPFWIYLNHRFSLSNIADHYWPLPGGLALIELLWSLRDALYLIIPLSLAVAVLYWVALQFSYGGICAYAFGDSRFEAGSFFGACAKHCWGYIKISLAAVLLFLMILLAADLIGQFISSGMSRIAGKTSGRLIHGLILFLAFYITAGFIANLKMMQIKNNITAFGPTITGYSKLVLSKLKPFLRINITGGLLTGFIMLILALILKIIYGMKFETATLLLTFFTQQATIFIWSYLEALQINLNVGLIKENENGADVE
jgi:hypothetical protein